MLLAEVAKDIRHGYMRQNLVLCFLAPWNTRKELLEFVFFIQKLATATIGACVESAMPTQALLKAYTDHATFDVGLDFIQNETGE